MLSPQYKLVHTKMI